MQTQADQRILVEIGHAPIDTGRMIAGVTDPAAGGIDVFIGTTRNHHRSREVRVLEYEAYAPMAAEELRRIAGEAMMRWPLMKVAVAHRIGRVKIGEASVVVACSAAHRAEAFEACRFIIDALKRDAPIWKKEYFADGEAWVGPAEGEEPPPGHP